MDERVSHAGKEGYSVMRRLVTFDADVDPGSNAPQALDDNEEERRDDANKIWFKERVVGRDEDQQILERGGDGTKRHTTRQLDEDQSVDMRRRTLETLDYPVVLRALADKCDSVFGRDLVVRRLSGGNFKGWSAATDP